MKDESRVAMACSLNADQTSPKGFPEFAIFPENEPFGMCGEDQVRHTPTAVAHLEPSPNGNPGCSA